MTPPVPTIGSAKNAAIESAPTSSISVSRAAASFVGTRERLGHEVAEALAVDVEADDARPEGVQAVVGSLARDDRPFGGSSEGRPVPARELGGGVDRVGAAARQEDLGVRDRASSPARRSPGRAPGGSRTAGTCGRSRASRAGGRPRPRSPCVRGRRCSTRGRPACRGSGCRPRPRGRRPRRGRRRSRRASPRACAPASARARSRSRAKGNARGRARRPASGSATRSGA